MCIEQGCTLHLFEHTQHPLHPTQHCLLIHATTSTSTLHCRHTHPPPHHPTFIHDPLYYKGTLSHMCSRLAHTVCLPTLSPTHTLTSCSVVSDRSQSGMSTTGTVSTGSAATERSGVRRRRGRRGRGRRGWGRKRRQVLNTTTSEMLYMM